jgi:hypothetical protein
MLQPDNSTRIVSHTRGVPISGRSAFVESHPSGQDQDDGEDRKSSEAAMVCWTPQIGWWPILGFRGWSETGVPWGFVKGWRRDFQGLRPNYDARSSQAEALRLWYPRRVLTRWTSSILSPPTARLF